MDVKLIVGNVAPTTTAHELEALFAQAGPVVVVQLLPSRDEAATQRSAHVTMANRTAAQTAIDLFHRKDLAGSELVVTFAPVRHVTPAGQGQLSAFSRNDRGGKARGGQSGALGAFGGGKSAPLPPRRRGGSQHR